MIGFPRAACRLIVLALAFASHAAAAPDAITPDGGSYYGPLVDGRLHGKGRVEWTNGSRYEGGFARGLYHGHARYRYASGDEYVGSFKNGMAHGEGRLTTPEMTYRGQFNNELFSGRGEAVYKDGRKYRGEWRRHQMHGKGRLELADGDVYEGDFVRDQFTGRGAYIEKSGARHEGAFVKWRLHGPGVYIDRNGNSYKGRFDTGEPSGTFRVATKSNGSYEGELRDWRPHGKGVLRLANGDVYEGVFEYGRYHGPGTLTHAKAADGTAKVEKGTWRYGSLLDPVAERQALENVEKALYGQKPLLEKALSSIGAREPGKINLYLLAVAGDGSQEVFRREVEFVQAQFDARFGTRSRSLRLVNSRNTVASEPMATVSSIRESLNAIAQRMDRSEDILFLFLTSHGSEEHEFVLNQNNMRLRGLPASELARILKETGIRWKVVVVSACYSGGFIEPLKDDTTLVITAARHDRRSFGCADENDFTYFGRAYFEQALPASASFREAFTKAETLIREREKKELKGAPESELSLPQIAGSKAIDERLQQWWSQSSR